MKAVRIHEHGDLDVLHVEDIPEPSPGPGEVRVAVRAAGLNHLDTWVRRGVPGHEFPLPITPGCDGAGVVSGVGAGVTTVKEGDEVVLAPGHSCGACPACAEGSDNLCRSYGILGETRDGTNAEAIVVPAVNAIPRPASLSETDAAALPLAFLTAWTMLVDRAGVRPGDVALVHAAGSGVGSAAIQIAKLFGATVITTASTPEKREKGVALGADHAVDYTREGWGFEVRKLTQRRGVDVVVDHVGGPTFETSLKTLRTGGRLVLCGATADAEVALNLRRVFFKNLAVIGSTMGSRGTVHRLVQLAGEGKLRAVVDRVVPLDDVRRAHALLTDRQVFGKVVLRVSE